MKKNNLWTGIGFVMAGILCLLAALLWETPLDSMLCGCFGAFTAPGITLIYRYIKWTRPDAAPLYQERLEQEQIDLRDERKSMLRDKSGRYAYILGMLTLAAAMPVFCILEAFQIIGKSESRLIVLFLAAYLLFQFVAGRVIYRLLDKRY